jgi:hypothetical protein
MRDRTVYGPSFTLESTGGNCTALGADAGGGWTWVIVDEDGQAPREESLGPCSLFLIGPRGEGQDVAIFSGEEWDCRERAAAIARARGSE